MRNAADSQMNARRTERTTGSSIDLGPGALHAFGPLRRIPADHFRELLGSASGPLVPALSGPPLDHSADCRPVALSHQLAHECAGLPPEAQHAHGYRLP